MVRPDMKNLLSGPYALVSPRVLLGVGLVVSTSLFGGIGCLSHSLTALTIEPATGDTCVVPGVSAEFRAYGTYTEGGHTSETEDITDTVTWSSTIPAVATVNSTGVATGVNLGTTSILASTQGYYGNLTAVSSINVESPCSATATIAKPLVLSVIPGNQSLTDVGQTTRLLAIGTYTAQAHTADLSRQAAWQSSDPRVATVDANGLVTAVAPGDATITARVKTPEGGALSAGQTVHFAQDQNQ
jgi:hypothetical protein